MFLPDINVWVAMTFQSHKHHIPSTEWFRNADPARTRFFCRQTQSGFLRLTNSLKMFPTDALTKTEAWQRHNTYLLDPRIGYMNEPAGVEPQWQLFTQGTQHSPNVWNDAYLAAFAICAGLELVTFDRGFQQFPGLKCTILQ
jgi:toxin-antitoxin system PIN domain toxin